MGDVPKAILENIFYNILHISFPRGAAAGPRVEGWHRAGARTAHKPSGSACVRGRLPGAQGRPFGFTLRGSH